MKTTSILNYTKNNILLPYCQNGECTIATVAVFFIGFPILAIVLFSVLYGLGFACGGVRGGSFPAKCQSVCYGGAASGCFSIFQSAGAGGCMGLAFMAAVLSVIGSGFATATWYLCIFTCNKLNGS